MLSLLYHEAKFNVIEGRYVVQPEEYDQLAGIQALIHLEHYNANTHTRDHYKYVLPSGWNWNFNFCIILKKSVLLILICVFRYNQQNEWVKQIQLKLVLKKTAVYKIVYDVILLFFL